MISRITWIRVINYYMQGINQQKAFLENTSDEIILRSNWDYRKEISHFLTEIINYAEAGFYWKIFGKATQMFQDTNLVPPIIRFFKLNFVVYVNKHLKHLT